MNQTNITRMSARAITVTATLMLLATPLVGVVAASSGSVSAAIASPANGATFTRLGNVLFRDASSSVACPISSYSWNFGDGATSASKNTSHQYSTLGNFVVTHEVVGSCGVTSTATATITIANVLPQSALLASPASAAAGSAVTLDASGSSDADGSIATYRFTINGAPQPDQPGATLSISPTAAGTYSASVVVVDNNGGVSAPASASFDIVAGALHTIAVTGPNSLIAGTTGTYDLAGADAHANPVVLAQSSLEFTAPETTGTTLVEYTEAGVTGSKAISVTQGPLASIVVSGPATVVAGTSAQFAVDGSDEYGNAVVLAYNTVQYLAPEASGPDVVSYTENDITGSLDITVVADALDSITLTGPAEAAAGSTVTFALAGLDAYGNAVALAETSMDFTASTIAGTVEHPTYSEGDITGTTDLLVVAGPLASLDIDGPLTVVAGTSVTYAVHGLDTHGNDIAVTPNTEIFAVPETVGPATLSVTRDGVTGTLNVEVTSDLLDAISITGPTTVVAAETNTYGLAGADQYGNPVTLAEESLDDTAPTTAGAHIVEYTESGVTGSLNVNVVAAALGSIFVTGPDSLVVGTTGDFVAEGYDAYGNSVVLTDAEFEHTAPTMVGSFQVCYEEGDISGCKTVSATVGPLAAITVSGPDSLVVGESGTYTFAGVDAYGNTVELAQTSDDVTAPTTAGAFVVSYTEDDVTGSKDVEAVAGPLATILISGPASMAAGSSVNFPLSGRDAYDNAVALSQASVAHTAPTTIGSTSVSYEESGITGTKTVNVVADALASIAVTGPSSMAAGSTATFAIAGADQYGNPVTLSSESFEFTAPTLAGSNVFAGYTENGVTGSMPVTVVASALDAITLAGPDSWVAGSSGSFELAGFDQYLNAVALSQSSLAFTADTTPGWYVVSYTEAGVTGSKTIEVVSEPPAYIVITGPGQVGVGSTSVYDLAGYDVNGNSVDLAQSTKTFTAPNAPAVMDVCYEERGVEGCQTVEVVAGALASITVTGPTVVPIGTTAVYALSGADAHGNAIALAQSSLSYTAATAGPVGVSYTEQGVTGSLSVLVTPLAVITVTGPTAVPLLETATFAVAGADEFGNVVPLAVSSISWTAPEETGPTTVCYTEADVTGCADVEVAAGSVHRIVVTTAAAVTNFNRQVQLTAVAYDLANNVIPDVTFTWSVAGGGRSVTAAGVFSAFTDGAANIKARANGVEGNVTVTVVRTLTTSIDVPDGEALGSVVGTVRVAFVDGANVAGASVTVTLAPTASSRASTTISGLTGPDGSFSFEAPEGWNLPIEYTATASVIKSGNTGSASDTYHPAL